MSNRTGVIATPHHLATRAGEHAFAQGGSAVDAALAAAAVLTVVYPHMCALGGDVQALLATADGRARALHGTGAAARAADATALSATHPKMPLHGVHPITVPGMVAAWGELHAALGRLPWNDLFAPAIELAAAGVVIAPALGRDLAALHDRLGTDAGLRAVFFHADGRVRATGERLVQPALAGSLEAIAEGGPRAFYDGDLGRRWLQGLRALGSLLTADDLAAHRSEWAEPIGAGFGEWQVWTTGAPSQGHVLLQLLAGIERLRLGSEDPLGPAGAALARLCAQTAYERDRCLADPRHVPCDVPAWISDATVEQLVRTTSDPAWQLPAAPAAPRPAGDTVAIVAHDAQGQAVTLIQSIFHAFGAGVLEPSTGIVCHNRGAAFTLDNGPARLTGGRRPPTTLTPSLLTKNGRVHAAFGAMGGKSQPQILAQLLMRMRAGTPAAQALQAPRWVVGTFGQGDEVVLLAEAAIDAVGRGKLTRSGLPVVVGATRDDRAGHAQFAGHDTDGAWTAATDPRGDGAAVPPSV